MTNFGYIMVLLDMLYGIEMEEEDIEELGLIAWNLIGNKNIKLYRYCAYLDENNSVTLPCNIATMNGYSIEDGVIEAVTADFEDWKHVSNATDFGDIHSAFTEHYIEGHKHFNSPYYVHGKYLKYEKVGNTLFFEHNYGKVNILYKGILMDENGLPQITEKEATAIATYIAYVTKFKEGLITNNAAITNQAAQLKAMWLLQCDLARVKYLNQNDMNNIIDIRNSFDRSWYGKSYKPIK